MALRFAKLLSPNQAVKIAKCTSLQYSQQLCFTDAYVDFPFFGTRQVVGFGRNGSIFYKDSVMHPYPAIHFKETTPDNMSLLDKQNGDWKKISLKEAKEIYRIEFSQTFEEILAPTGDWKLSASVLLIMLGFSMAIYLGTELMLLKKYPLPDSFNMEWRHLQRKFQIDNHENPVIGVASKWDYEKKRWKE